MISINCQDHLYFLYKNNQLKKVVCSAKPMLSTSEKIKNITFECKNGEIQPIRDWIVPGGNIYGSDLKELIVSTQSLVNLAKLACLKGESSTIEIKKKR